jgi:hypothetical protein
LPIKNGQTMNALPPLFGDQLALAETINDFF